MKKFKKFFIIFICFAFLSSGFFNISSIQAGGSENKTTLENISFPYGIGLSSQPFFDDLEKNYEKWKNNLGKKISVKVYKHRNLVRKKSVVDKIIDEIIK